MASPTPPHQRRRKGERRRRRSSPPEPPEPPGFETRRRGEAIPELLDVALHRPISASPLHCAASFSSSPPMVSPRPFPAHAVVIGYRQTRTGHLGIPALGTAKGQPLLEHTIYSGHAHARTHPGVALPSRNHARAVPRTNTEHTHHG
jgi:hypothetical protein